MIDEEKKGITDDETPKDIVVELPDEDTTDNQEIETVETTEEPSDTEVPEEEVVEEETEEEESETVEEETEEPKDNKVFGKRAEKRIKRLVAQKKELEEKLKGYESEKDKWLDEKSELRSRQADSELDAINQYMERLESQEAQALSVLRTAKEASDVDAEIKATDVLASVKAEKLVAKQYKARAEKGLGTKKPDSTARTETKVEAKPNTAQLPDRKALAWQKRNKWFGGNDTGDRIKTQAALVIHKELLDEGINPQDVAEEYYSELDARLTTEFPTLRKQTVRRVPTVVGGTRSATGKRKVTLTGQEIEMADRLGVTYQDYAREKLRQDKAGS
jgi:hypothetical protein|tara:strand:- start:368 stop:1366 length:999 start_codon:yes stop_codon:yes gene_type:complete